MIRAIRDDSLAPRIVSSRSLLYTEGANAADDRPAHVRAGSGLALHKRELFVVQDDANFVARVELDRDVVRAIALPRGEGGRRLFSEATGNKAHKHDFEACFVHTVNGEAVLVGVGSGSTSARCSILIVSAFEAREAAVRILEASSFFAALANLREFSGAELNIEGATCNRRTLRLFQRGNGRARDGHLPQSATCDFDAAQFFDHIENNAPLPLPTHVRTYDLGTMNGVPLTFTDAALLPDGRTLFLAAAEDSPDTYHDGVVVGTALGILENDGSARYAPITHSDGTPFLGKPEGIAPNPANSREGFVVIDKDDPDLPCELVRIAYNSGR